MPENENRHESDEQVDVSYQQTWGASAEEKEELIEELGLDDENEGEETPQTQEVTKEERAKHSPAGDPDRPESTPQGPSQ